MNTKKESVNLNGDTRKGKTEKGIFYYQNSNPKEQTSNKQTAAQQTISPVKAPMNDWYAKDASEVLTELHVTPDKGLSSDEAEERLHQHGLNELRKEKEVSALTIFFGQFTSPLIWLLVGATLLSLFLGKLVDAGIILAIIILNAIIGFNNEYKAERTIEALQKLTAPHSKVVRNGRVIQIESRYLVPGDIILVETGDKIAADARIIETLNLQTQEAALTGESTPVDKSAPLLKGKISVADQKNMLFAGTIVTSGHAKAVVVAIGMTTQFGKIAQLVQQAKPEPTPLQQKFTQIAKMMSFLAIAIIVITFTLGILRGQPWLDMLLVAVSLAVAAVPEGLPAVVTIALAMGVQRMARRNALMRKLPNVETLGSVTVICTDKTGTLTHNEMTVRKLWASGATIDVSGSGYAPTGSFSLASKQVGPKSSPTLSLLLRIGMLCNNAKLTEEEGHRTVIGDPTEGCLIVSAEKAGLDIHELNEEYPRTGEIEFTSERKMMTTLHRTQKSTRLTALTKGAPDVLLKNCSWMLVRGKPERLSKEMRNQILQTNEEFARQALRVLGFAYKENITPGTKLENIEEGMVFVGLQAMIDPPRAEAKEAVQKCKSAGIKVVMITGDHKATAEAIAREIGIEGESLSGEELEAMLMDELKKHIEHITIFARVNPDHKLKIIDAFKAMGHIVAMTGDGVNDAPALKKADIGIAMGITGTDVSKEASGMILLDDNFASIVNAIEEGRGVYNNIRKFFAFLLSGNLGELGIIIIAILIGLPTPLTAPLILLINLFTDGLPATALSVDPFEPNAMSRKPTRLSDPITKGLSPFLVGYPIIMTIAVLVLFYVTYSRSGNLAQAQTTAFLTMAFFELYQAFAARSTYLPAMKVGLFKNKYLVGAVLISLATCLAVVYVPFLQNMFKTAPLSVTEILIIMAVASTGALYIEIHKWVKSRKSGVGRGV